MVMQYNWASFCPAKINHRFFLSSVSEKLLSNTRLLTTETQLIERYSTCQEQSVLNCSFAEGESLVRAFHQQTPQFIDPRKSAKMLAQNQREWLVMRDTCHLGGFFSTGKDDVMCLVGLVYLAANYCANGTRIHGWN